MLLPDVDPQLLQVGEWVNVIGYVQGKHDTQSLKLEMGDVPVQAVLLWSAGAVDIAEYERVVSRRIQQSQSMNDI